MASWYLGPGTPTISDTKGNTYTLLPPLTGGGAGNGEQTSILIWYASNIAAGANTVTINGVGIDVGITAVEYSGVATSAPIGITSTLPYFGGTPTTTPTSNSFTPGSGSLLFVAFADETNGQSSIAAGNGYTLIQGDGNHVDIEEDNVSSSAGPQTASITVGTATWSWAMYVVEFLPASAGPPPIGTVLWTNNGDGSGFSSIVPAVPSVSGVADIFGLQNDGTVAAITSAGTTAWSADVSQAGSVVPDFLGGLVLIQQYGASYGNNSIVRLDGITGQPYPSYLPNPATANLIDAAVHTNGTVFAVQQDVETSVLGINPTTGTQIFATQLLGSSQGSPYFNVLTNLIIAGDGYGYLAYSYLDGSGTYPFVTHLMLLRVDSSGNATNLDIVDVPAYQNGALVTFQANVITNADTGTLISWGDTYIPLPDLRRRTAPALTRHNPQFRRADMYPPNPLGFGPTYGMAITAGATVTTITPPAVSGQITNIAPVLQREDGSFVGTVGVGDPNSPQYNMAAFGQTGNLLWTVTNDQPQIANPGGGVVGQTGTTYDQIGNVTGTSQDPGGVPDWSGQFYSMGLSGVQLLYSWVGYGAGFWSVAGGNPSGSATSVANVGLLEGLPLFMLPQKIPCTVGSVKSNLGGQASIQYNHFRPLLLAGLQAPTLPLSCSNLFNGQSGRPTLSAVITAVENQIAYAGPASNLSLYAAGEWVSPANCPSQIAPCLNQTLYDTFPVKFQDTPVCWGFLNQSGSTVDVATAQVQPPGTDVYITTLPNKLNQITQSLILHEALHNLTGLGDDDLYKLLTGLKRPAGPSVNISTALVTMGCAAN